MFIPGGAGVLPRGLAAWYFNLKLRPRINFAATLPVGMSEHSGIEPLHSA